jgi:hypothetical protein
MIQTWVARYDILESSCGDVLCVALDENSVVIICRSVSRDICWGSRI